MKKGVKKFTLMEIMIVVAIVAILGSIAVPSFMKYRETAHNKQKEHFIQVVKMAKERWSMDYSKPQGTAVSFDDIKGYLPLIDSYDQLTVSQQQIKINPVGSDPTY